MYFNRSKTGNLMQADKNKCLEQKPSGKLQQVTRRGPEIRHQIKN